MRKPTTANGYIPELAGEARQLCLYVATILGDLIDEVVVIGGLVPYLIVDQALANKPHVGTRDLDLGLSLAVLDDARYREISARLRERGFEPGHNEAGNVTRQTWVLPGQRVSVDFLVPESAGGPAPGKLQDLEADFAAIVAPALPVAFEDFIEGNRSPSPFAYAARNLTWAIAGSCSARVGRTTSRHGPCRSQRHHRGALGAESSAS